MFTALALLIGFMLIVNTKHFLLGFDQWVNTWVYIEGDGWGMADEALSARAWRCFTQDLISEYWYLGIDLIFFWQPNHCFNAWRAEVERRQLPDIYSLES